MQTNTNTNNAAIASYQSNALGERTMASYPTAERQQTRYYLYDQQQRIAELDEAGNVVQQYLYVNQTPVAVINTPTEQSQQSDKQSPTGIIAIHTDRRHAPMMATDEQGKIIWQAEYDAWGKVMPASLREERGNPNQSNQNIFNLSLRLPGQWQDEATGLYYNYQRDYNPETGRYLTPDPLGFPDGADPYAYVNNDPLNKLDPLGLYGIDVHYYMTYFLALVAGIPEEQAQVMALATQYIDDNFETSPITGVPFGSLPSYHFTLDYNRGFTGDNKLNTVERFKDPNSTQLNKLLVASVKQTNICAKTQLFGEYLHAFEDTFSHRDKFNLPYQVESNPANNPQRETGHVDLFPNPFAEENHQPDHTYNQSITTRSNDPTQPGAGKFYVDQWAYNELRTLQMEKEVFEKMRWFAANAGYLNSADDYYFHDWSDLAGNGTARIGLPENANQDGVTDDNGNKLIGYKPGNTSNILQKFNSTINNEEKVKLLNNWLRVNALPTIPDYNEAKAKSNRDRYLDGLNPKDLDGVILD